MQDTILLLLYLTASVNEIYGMPRSAPEIVNNRPIIAVLAQHTEYPYIAASYVKYLESAGARVVPVHTNVTADEIKSIFSYVNGVLYPGGGAEFFVSNYYKNALRFYQLALEANQKGDYFPIWGTCLGFQTLSVIATNTANVVSELSSEDYALPLHFTHAAFGSRMFKSISKTLYRAMATQGLTYNHHHYGVSLTEYETDPKLKEIFKVLSTNLDSAGKTFVSTVEAYDYPFYGTQWHPEKNNFEFNTNENIPHTSTAIESTQYVANVFVKETRKSNHRFPSAKVEEEYLIYKYKPTYTGVMTGGLKNFEQVYFF